VFSLFVLWCWNIVGGEEGDEGRRERRGGRGEILCIVRGEIERYYTQTFYCLCDAM
jgi:hypothetical protein